jgi:hypothetical protein
MKVPTMCLDKLPSAIASAKLKELIEAKTRVQASASNTLVARLTHARLFGSDSPYEERSTEEIVAEMGEIRKRYVDHDNHFLFEERSTPIQLVVFNQGTEEIKDASLSLLMPNHNAFHVATQLPKVPRDNTFIARTPSEQSDYPAVSMRDGSVHVSIKLGDILPGEPMEVFRAPLRISVGEELKGRRVGIQYSLLAQNLRAAAKGKLRLIF